MARAPSPAEVSASDAVKARIRGVGLRCTAARLTVLQHLMRSLGPETHAEVSEALVDEGFDRATIYRNLTELTEAGLVARVELGDHVWRFEIKRHGREGAKGEDHPHFLCTSCGEVSCLDDVTVAITPRLDAVARGHSARHDRPAKPGHAKPRSVKAGGKSRGIRSVTEVLLKGQCENCG